MPQATIDRLIVNSPYDEPSQHWHYDRNARLFDLAEGRRPAGYVVASQDSRTFDDPGKFVEIPLVNRIRPRVKAWREAGWPGASATTRRLLGHWTDPEDFATRRFFFCQIEAIETLIWLAEASSDERAGIDMPSDGGEFQRLCAKMATGAGKTIVMAMLIAWQVLNKVERPHDKRFSRNVLVVAPGLTVKSRLAVLKPENPENYYAAFRIVPQAFFDKLRQGRVIVRNWHALNWESKEKVARRRSVDKRGVRSDEAYVRDVLGDMATARNILVVNDEAHHAWRTGSATRLRGVAKAQIEEATKWVGGLDRIGRTRGILRCYDFSATPFAPSGGRSSEEALFGWIVSDFGLNDAIEAGLVKTPRVVVRDDAVPDAKSYKSRFYHIYNDAEVKPDLNRRAAEADPLPDLVVNGYHLLGYDWRETAKAWRKAKKAAPPAMITVANRTETAARIKHAFDKGKIPVPELCDPERTLHIDSKALAKAEAAVEVVGIGEDGGQGELSLAPKRPSDAKNAAERAELLRRQVDTVGRPGEPGGQIQNVISVGMLSEGWDAKTVTHIMGLRAFASQLLCEQVVGRGLRRTAYEINVETGLFDPEYVNVFGVPFTFLPHEHQEDVVPTPPSPKTAVEPVREKRKHEISWPNVIRVDRAIRQRLVVDWSKLESLRIDLSQVASIAELAPVVDGKPDMTKIKPIDLQKLAGGQRMQTIVFRTAAEAYDAVAPDWPGDHTTLIVQLVRLAEDFIRSGHIRIEPPLFADDPEKRRLVLALNMRKLVLHLIDAVQCQNTEELVPVFDSDRPIRSTGDMMTWYTGKPCEHTERSHVNVCVYDSAWESSEAFALDNSPLVSSWVKNDHLGFEIFYVHNGVVRKYRPDFLVRLESGAMLVLEVKGVERERDRTKWRAMDEWATAVNAHGGFGHWSHAVSRKPGDVHTILATANAEAGDLKRGRTGFMKGQLQVPEDFDQMGQEVIQEAFEGRE